MGVKGARLTVTPRGTTYVTVGSHGFYYRETLLHRDDIQQAHPIAPPAQPEISSAEDTIATAASMDLVDSSSERLIQQLNKRANMFNPAWILYVAAAFSLAALAMLPSVPSLALLPDVTMPFSSERTALGVDEYAALTARFGEPNSILYAEADPLAPIPTGTARYTAANVRVTFVPNGCVVAYYEVMRIRSDRSLTTASANRRMRRLSQCLPPTISGWTTVAYMDSVDNNAISADIATRRLDAILAQQMAAPIVETANTPGNKQQPISKLGRKQLPAKPAMKSNAESRLAAEQTSRDIKDAKKRMLYSRVALPLVALGFFIAGVVVHKSNTEERTSRLFYELDEVEQKKYSTVQESLGLLSKCHRIWRIESDSPTADWKRNAGASSLVRRTTIGVRTLNPPRVQTNVQVPCIDMGRVQLYFFPDIILYRDGIGYGAIAYGDFRLTQGFTRFIESEGVPTDATVVDHTWRYVNRNGGPDRRFNNNRQLPVLQLGVLVLTSSGGLNLQLNTSNPQLSLAFAVSWQTRFRPAGQRYEQRTDHQPPPPPQTEPSSSQSTIARKLLGLRNDASDAEISAAYRHLAQMYHPDKVAGLAPEFQALVDKRMKEINAAHETLKRKT